MSTTSRREFLLSTAAVAAAVPLLARCGGSPDPVSDGGAGEDAASADAAGEDGGSFACADGAEGAIATNHGHSLTLPRAHVEAGVRRTYDIQGSAAHNHTVTVEAADFARLATGDSVVLTSSSGALHTHRVTVRCA